MQVPGAAPLQQRQELWLTAQPGERSKTVSVSPIVQPAADQAMRRAIRYLLTLGIAGWLALAPLSVRAAEVFPQHTIRFIVPFSAGGGTDVLARSLAQVMTKSLGQTVIVDNRPGGATVTGTQLVARAAPDGYTLLFTANPFTVNPALLGSLPYDTVKDFTPVTLVARSPLLLVVTPSVAAHNVAGLIALAKREPGTLNYASSGIGGPEHMAGALFATMAGVKIVHVPFKGSGPALTALLGGEVQMSFTSLSTALPSVQAGKLRPLAITAAEPSKAHPEWPTVADAGNLPGFEMITWYGVIAPAGTPGPVIDKLRTAIVAGLADPAITDRLAHIGAEPVGDEPPAFTAFISRDMARYQQLVHAGAIHKE
jgi:tripartite-type tricarboxylate transporter receptor subunit TctC